MKDQMAGKTKRGVIQGIRKADIILIAVCLSVAVLLGIYFVAYREAGSTVRILYDGIELKEISLYSAQTDSMVETGSQYFLITYRDDVVDVETFESRPELPEGISYISYNLIAVTDGTVTMDAADCKDQICVHHKPISSKAESIICLPHRLVVEIDSGENTDESLDGVVR